MNLGNAHALVTGGSRGIGPRIARALLARGASVTITARTRGDLELIRHRLDSDRVAAVTADVTNPGDRVRLLAEAESALGPVDVLVNNAGIEEVAPFAGQAGTTIARIVATNLDAPMQIARLVLPGMLERARGHIVNVSSIAGKAAVPYNTAYAATKHGLNGFTYSLRSELRGTGVGVSAVLPGYVEEVGLFSRWADTRVPRGSGARTTARKVAAAVVRAIERDLVEVLVSGLLPRLSDLALAISPRMSDALARRTGAYGLLEKQARTDRDRP